ncbi:MAG: MATE family efflux transporter [Clostridia bacterium]|nr:MATE family efflux transporter [Clostridia bacterium]
MRKSSVNLTQGNILKQIILFALPILVGQIVQNLYNSVDSIVVGNAVGTTALAAVSSSSDISHLIIGFFTGLSTGAGVLFSRYFGAGDQKNLHDSIHTALTFATILGTFMTVVGIILTPFLLNIVDCPEDVYAEAESYLRIYFIGVLFTAMYNVASGVLRAVGDSRSPFVFLIISSATNIILDLLLVLAFGLGVIGTAIATIVSQLLSVVLVTVKMLRTDDVYKLVLKDLGIKKDLLLKVMYLGLPAAVQASLTSISNLFVQRYINQFGSAAMAGIGAAKKIDRFAGMVAQSVGLAAATFVGQNYGAKKFHRAYRGIRICLLICAVFVLVVGSTIYFNADFFIRIFTSDSEAIFYGVAMMTTMLPFYYVQSVNQVFANAVRGFGKSLAVMFCSISGMIVCRQIFLAISMHYNYDIHNIYIGFPVGWGFAALFVFIYYIFAVRRKFKSVDFESEPVSSKESS